MGSLFLAAMILSSDPIMPSTDKQVHKRARIKYYAAHPNVRLLENARRRSRIKGLECTITAEDVTIPKRCPVLDIPIITGTGKCLPNSPSIERINNDEGYTPDNIVVISYRANILKRDASFDELKRIFEYYKPYMQ